MKPKVLFISSTGGHLSEMMQLKSLFLVMIIILLRKKPNRI